MSNVITKAWGRFWTRVYDLTEGHDLGVLNDDDTY